MTNRPLIEPLNDNNTPAQTAKTLEQIRKTLGRLPNVFRTVAHSPMVMHSLWNQYLISDGMLLSSRAREAIGIRVSQLNGCDACVTAHIALCVRTGVEETVAVGFSQGQSDDPKEQTLLALTTKIVEHRGHYTGFVIEMARKLGVSDGEIIEVIALISMHTFSNFVTNVANTDLNEQT